MNQTFSSYLRQGSAYLGLILLEEVNSVVEACDPGTVSMENGTARGLIYLSHSDPFLTRQLRTMFGRIAKRFKCKIGRKDSFVERLFNKDWRTVRLEILINHYFRKGGIQKPEMENFLTAN